MVINFQKCCGISVVLLLSIFWSCNKNYSVNNLDEQPTVLNDSGSVDAGVSDSDFSTSEVNFNYLPSSTTNQLVRHSHYTLSYNEKYEQAEWVAYELKSEYVKNNQFTRPFFNEDPKVLTGSADWRNYKNSGYDKGHLCPAGDMEFAESAYNDTFLTSNISPQNHDFNEGIWNLLEQQVRLWAKEYNGIYVIGGGILNNSLERIGYEKVAVPRYFYKIVGRRTANGFRTVAFLIPNQDSNGSLNKFVVSVDELEMETGIDFFPALPDALEKETESLKDTNGWTFNVK